MQTLKHPPGFWKRKINQRAFLDQLASKFNIESPKDWGRLSTKRIFENGGYNLLSHYNKSLFKTLKSVYSEINWNIDWFHQTPRNYWRNEENQFSFLEKMRSKFGIRNEGDWKNISHTLIEENGGKRIIVYNKSLKQALKKFYRVEENFSTNLYYDWMNADTQRNFLSHFATVYKLHHPRDWGKVTIAQIEDFGGYGLLAHYQKSIFEMLKSVFPEHQWKREWFPRAQLYKRSYWENNDNQRKFLETMAETLCIKNPADWRKVNSSLLQRHGGRVCKLCSKGSLAIALRSLWPEKWRDFCVQRKSEPQAFVYNELQQIFWGIPVFENYRNSPNTSNWYLQGIYSDNKIDCSLVTDAHLRL